MALMEMDVEKQITLSLKKELTEALKSFSGELCWYAPLAPYTSLKVGGSADLLLFPHTIADLALLMPILTKYALPVFVLGFGSNLLIRDGGVAGAVIHLKYLNQIEQIGAKEVYAESGVAYPKLSIFAMDQGLSGLEFASGIPGSVGGAVAMNAGIPNYETAQTLKSVTLMDVFGKLQDYSASNLKFSYRKTALPEKLIVSAIFALTPATQEAIKRKMKHFLKQRQQTQPLQKPNCGSVFKNPPGHYAGALIETAGLKGFHIGDAQISERHGNFILNQGAATATDCLALIKKMQETVKKQHGIRLELEVKVIGRNLGRHLF